MSSALRAVVLVACAATLYAQAPAANPPGLETSWEIAPAIQELGAHAGRLLPLLDKIDTRAWVEKGASDTYTAQLQSSKEQAKALAVEAKALAARPERLSAALQVLFRVQALDGMLASLADGVRRYQSPREAQELASLAAEAGAGRERLQRYIVNLAAEQEQNLEVMDKEAQRCRGIITAPAPKSSRKR